MVTFTVWEVIGPDRPLQKQLIGGVRDGTLSYEVPASDTPCRCAVRRHDWTGAGRRVRGHGDGGLTWARRASSRDCATTSTGAPWPPHSIGSASVRAGAASTSGPAGATSRWPWPRWWAGRPGLRRRQRPAARDEVARAAAAHAQVIALTQAGEDLCCPSRSTWPSAGSCCSTCIDPPAVVRRMAAAVRPGGWVVAQEPITTAGRIDGAALLHARRPPPRRRRPAAGPGPRGRSRGGRRLGRGPGGGGPGPVASYLER